MKENRQPELRKLSPGLWEVGIWCGALGHWDWSDPFAAKTIVTARKLAVSILAAQLKKSAARFRVRSDEALGKMQALVTEAALLEKMPQRAPWWPEVDE